MPKADWGAGVSGAVQGGVQGAAMGGPWGAAIGAITGGAGGLWGGKKKKKKKRLSTLDPNQQNINQMQYDSFLNEGPFADLYNYNPEMANQVFDENIANPAYRKFQEEMVPGITGQFRDQGLMKSTYAGDAVSRLARDVQENLNAKRSEYLYNQEQSAQQAKRAGIENYQNRQTFAYDKASSGGGGFNINQILDSITPENIESFKKWMGS